MQRTFLGKVLAAACLFVTLLAYAIWLFELNHTIATWLAAGNWRALSGLALFWVLVTGLVYSNLVFQLSRSGHYRRAAEFCPPDEGELHGIYDRRDPPRLLVLVPSYREEWRVIWQTLI